MGRKRCLRQLQEEPELQFFLPEQHSSGLCQGHWEEMVSLICDTDIYGPQEQNHIKHRVSGYLIPLKMQAAHRCIPNKRKGVQSLATEFYSTHSQHKAISWVVLDHW